MVAVDAVRGSRRSTKAMAAGHRPVFANWEAALIAAQFDERYVGGEKFSVVKHDVLSR